MIFKYRCTTYFDHIHSLLHLSNSHGLPQDLPSYFRLSLPPLGATGAAHMHMYVRTGSTSNGHLSQGRGYTTVFLVLTHVFVVSKNKNTYDSGSVPL